MLDHLFVVLFAVVYPLAGFIGFRRLLRKIQKGAALDRNHLYLNTIASHWILFVLLLMLWANAGRKWGGLGFSLEPGIRLLTAVGIGMAIIVFLRLRLRQVGGATQADLSRLQNEFGVLFMLVPRNASELLRFNLLSVTAGIVEETLWRGYLIWYLGQVMPLWAAALISAAGFGIAHAYQGLASLPRIVLVGGVFAALYVLSGSVWLAMILHAAVDLMQGRLAFDALRRLARRDGQAAGAQGSA